MSIKQQAPAEILVTPNFFAFTRKQGSRAFTFLYYYGNLNPLISESFLQRERKSFLKISFTKFHLNKIFCSCLLKEKICPLRGHILIARFARSSQVWARLGRAIWSSRFALRSVLCSLHTFKFIYYNLILKLKPIL